MKKVYHKHVVKIHKQIHKEVLILTVRERVLALRLLEKQKKNPELAKQLGINIEMIEKRKEDGLKKE